MTIYDDLWVFEVEGGRWYYCGGRAAGDHRLKPQRGDYEQIPDCPRL